MNEPTPVILTDADWPVRTVGEMTTLLRRGTAPIYVDDSNVMAIGQRCVTDADFDGSLSRPHSARATARIVTPEPDDVLINSTGTGTIGRSVIFRDEARKYIVDGHVTVARPRQSELISRWLNDVLRSPAGQRYLEARCYAGSTNQIELSSSALAAMPIAAPQVAEQRQVAEVLDTLDQQITATERIIAKLEVTKNGLLTELFMHGTCDSGGIRGGGGDSTESESSHLGLTPMNWCEASVAELISLGYLVAIQDGNHGELHPKRTDFSSDGIPFLMARDISNGRIDLDGCYRIRREQYLRLRVGFSRPGDVLLSHKGTIGEVAVVPEMAREVVLSPQITYYRTSARLLPQFLSFYMQSGFFQRALRAVAAQSTRDYVGIGAQRRLMRIPVPTLPEQYRIVSVARGADDRLLSERARLTKLRLVRVGLTADLLTGRIRIPPGVAS
jgi:type I restriction enzyme S subunit